MITAHDYLIHPGKHSGELRGYTLPSAFKEAATACADNPAVFDGKGYRSWHEWWQEASAIARSLQHLGVSKGDVVALHLPNCWEYLTLHVAVAMIGAVTFPLHMAYGEHELRALLERAAVSVLVLPSASPQSDRMDIGQRLLSALSHLRHLLVVGSEEQANAISIEALVRQWDGVSPLPVEVQPDDPFVLLASSGTTSLRSKICIHSHDGLLSNAAAVVVAGKARADDTVISASPFTHLFGLLSIHLCILSKCQQALLSGWKTQHFLDLVHRSDATVAFAVPAQLRDVCLYFDTHSDAPHINLREMRTGGAKVSSSLVTDVQRVLDASVIVQWGMSEVGAGTFTRPEDPPAAASTGIGSAVTGAEVRIVDANNEDNQDGSPLPIGETGELWYRSPYMFRGYLYDEELSLAAVTADGWLRTGDLASLNVDGNVAYQGRRTELINRGGLKFNAVEVESLLVDLVQLNQFTIIARADERLGERSCLVASIRPGYTITLADVVAHLAAKGLAKYKWPEELLLLDELPSTPTGKIARARLANLLLAQVQQEL